MCVYMYSNIHAYVCVYFFLLATRRFNYNFEFRFAATRVKKRFIKRFRHPPSPTRQSHQVPIQYQASNFHIHGNSFAIVTQ